MISLILVGLAAGCNAVMDKITHHYGVSIFKNLNPLFWDPRISWQNKYKNGERRKLLGIINYPVQLTDAWHLFKSLLITFLGFAVACHQPMYGVIADTTIYLGIWWLVFELLYSRIFVNKN